MSNEGILNWFNLLNMKCPSCAGPLQERILEPTVSCRNCEFIISMKKFTEVVKSLYNPRKKTVHVEDNAAALNNL